MPINLINYTDAKDGEKGVVMDHLCDGAWEMPEQIATLEAWLKQHREKVPKGNYVADIGFSPRVDAAGGGAVLTSEAMEIMVALGMELFLSEYPQCEEDNGKNKNEERYRLYVGSTTYLYPTFQDAVMAAQEKMDNGLELRIEVLVETEGADFWAYEYQSKKWVPS